MCRAENVFVKALSGHMIIIAITEYSIFGEGPQIITNHEREISAV